MTLKKKRPAKWTWNKGIEVGQKDAFTPAQVKRIRQVLADRGAPGLRDLALFSVAIDTMLQGPELLNLTVKDVALANGTIRPIIEVARTRRKPPVRCALSKAARTRRSRRWMRPAKPTGSGRGICALAHYRYQLAQAMSGRGGQGRCAHCGDRG